MRAAAGTNAMRELTETIEIEADPAVVWSTLMTTEAYPEWNPLLRIDGDLRRGRRPRVRLRLPGLPAIYLRPRIVAVVPERELRWRSRFPGFVATHTFRLEPIEDGTRFVQEETFSGAFAGPFVDRFERASSRGFEQMNRHLERRVERRTTAD